MTNDLKRSVVEALKEHQEKPEDTETVLDVAVHGNGNIVSGHHSSNTIIKTEKVVHRPHVTVTPGIGCITSEQGAILYRLVHEIGALETIARKEPRNYGSIWNAVNKLCGVTTYKEIPAEKYSKAEKYLRQWLGRLSSTKTAKKSDPGWRKRKLAYIHTNVKQLNCDDKLRVLLRDKYGVKSLTEVSDDDLAVIYSAVASWKQTAAQK
jgi:hypothetical protein